MVPKPLVRLGLAVRDPDSLHQLEGRWKRSRPGKGGEQNQLSQYRRLRPDPAGPEQRPPAVVFAIEQIRRQFTRIGRLPDSAPTRVDGHQCGHVECQCQAVRVIGEGSRRSELAEVGDIQYRRITVAGRGKHDLAVGERRRQRTERAFRRVDIGFAKRMPKSVPPQAGRASDDQDPRRAVLMTCTGDQVSLEFLM
ncbi:hypothetical protein [Nocardia abscessus]|uniref:hypothetical protein n=1 Tax=Nocardia abscessus TaxID=120957 RepID=UPI0024574B5C|nr:hypothetical protein [Nocardia abscessus]